MNEKLSHFDEALTALNRIDPNPTVAALSNISAERAKLDAADRDAVERLTDLAQRIQAARERGLNEEAAADALLAGGDVLEAADDLPRLEAERKSLLAAQTAIRQRLDALDLRKAAEKVPLQTELLQAARPYAAALADRAREAIATLATAYADSVAIQTSTGCAEARSLAERIAWLLIDAAHHKLIVAPAQVGVSSNASAILSAAEPAAKVLARAVPSSISWPPFRLRPDAQAAAHALSQMRAEQASMRKAG